MAKLRAHQMHYADYKFRWARARAQAREGWGWGPMPLGRTQKPWQVRVLKFCLCRLARSTLTLIPLLGVHEVVFAFVTDEHAQGTLRSTKLFFDLFLSSFQVSPHHTPSLGPRVLPLTTLFFQGLLVAVLYCFLNKEVGEAGTRIRAWHRGQPCPGMTIPSSPLLWLHVLDVRPPRSSGS